MGVGYQALYRVWRPQQFTDVVGQEHVTKTLQNALLQQKISHAYLFSGPRGTGKTSAAKILAKAVNCEKAPTKEPCNECDACRGITDGSISDVIEIDAASNNGVDEIRDIRDKVKYAPSVTKYKVYIIDEVHMLSIGAFNALLKTLEEPPQHVIFILATTEPHKIPLTILSRCQRFDFKRITVESIVNRLKLIVEEIGVNCDEQALQIIARAADGGMRDALSLLDQAISFSEDKVTVDDALTVTGAVSQNYLNQLANAIHERDVAKGLDILHKLLFEGKEPVRFIEDFILYYRDLLLYQTSPTLEESFERVVLDNNFKELAQSIDRNDIFEIIDILNKTQQEMKFTNHPRIFVEVAIVKLCQLEKKENEVPASKELQELLQRVAHLEKELSNLKENGVVKQNADEKLNRPKPVRPQTKGYRVPQGKVFAILKEATKKDLQLIKSRWGEMMEKLAEKKMKSLAALLNDAEPAAASSSAFIIKFKYEIHCQMAMENAHFVQTLSNIYEQWTGTSMQIIGVPEEQWQQLREEFLKGYKEIPTQDEIIEVSEDRLISEAIKLFGEDLIEIKE